MRTLCVVCHSEVTKAQQGERKLMRKRAKEQLKLVMMQVKGNGSTELTDPHSDVSIESNIEFICLLQKKFKLCLYNSLAMSL